MDLINKMKRVESTFVSKQLLIVCSHKEIASPFYVFEFEQYINNMALDTEAYIKRKSPGIPGDFLFI